MSCAGRTGFTPNLVVGLTITVAGGVLLLDRLGLMEATEALRYWPALLILFGASVIAQALAGGPAAASGSAPRPIIGPGFVILLVFISVMVSNAWRGGNGWPDRQGQNVFAVMGNTTRTSEGEPFDGADMMTLMGRSRLDLREARLAPGEEAYIDVVGIMGGVDVLVPEGWDVDVEAVPLMGRVRDRRLFPRLNRELTPSTERGREAGRGEQVPRSEARPDSPAPRLIVRGFIMMGALNIES